MVQLTKGSRRVGDLIAALTVDSPNILYSKRVSNQHRQRKNIIVIKTPMRVRVSDAMTVPRDELQ